MPESEQKQRIVYRVAAVLDQDMQIVINAGGQDGLKVGDEFLIYSLSVEPIVDPVTKQPLENLVTIRGYGRIVFVQDRIATVQSSKQVRLAHTRPGSLSSIAGAFASLYPDRVYEDEVKASRPFDDPQVGDYARLIS